MMTPNPAAAAYESHSHAPMPGGETAVPMTALAVDGTSPEVGDEVTFISKGKVMRIDAETAFVHVVTMNDTPVAAPARSKSPDEDMMDMARRDDEQMEG